MSGKNYLEFAGDIDLSGDALGTLLLDPDDIDIVAGTANPGDFVDDTIAFGENAGLTTTIGADTLSGRLSANANVILQANNTIDVNAAVTSTGSGDLMLETAAGGTITVNNAIDVNTGDLTLIADEIDVLANLSGSGDIQLTSADVMQQIEIGSTDATDLNLTATELGFLQDGWNLITIGASDRLASITVNEAISFSDHTELRNSIMNALDQQIDVNANITTTDNSDLSLYGRGVSGAVHSFNGVHIETGVDVNVARDLIIDTNSYDYSLNADTIIIGRDFNSSSGGNTKLNSNMTIGRNFTLNHSSSNAAHRVTFNDGVIDAVGNVLINMQSVRALQLLNNSILEADGNITITTPEIEFDSTAQIRSGSGTSNLTFLETGEDDAMELGGTSAGHTWQMTTAEIDVIQDGFNSITFGSTTHVEAIDITSAVSFSDDVSFFNTGNDATIAIQNIFITTDSANATFESGSAANVGGGCD